MGSRLIALLGNFGDWTVVKCILGGFVHPFYSVVFFVPVSSPQGEGEGGEFGNLRGEGGGTLYTEVKKKCPKSAK